MASTSPPFTLVTRAEWDARESTEINYMGTPVSVVFVHHTSMRTCTDLEEGCEEMRVIQNLHMDDRGWDDIGYNFLVDQEGRVFEARGWDRIGAHTFGWNNVAVAVSIMGDYSQCNASEAALSALNAVIEHGVKLGKVTSDYTLYGHKDVRNTDCPGDKVYEAIQTWSHYDFKTPVKPTPKPYVTLET